MSGGKECTQQYTETSNDDVGDAQKRILPAHDGSSRDDDGFGTTVDGHGEICPDIPSESAQASARQGK